PEEGPQDEGHDDHGSRHDEYLRVVGDPPHEGLHQPSSNEGTVAWISETWMPSGRSTSGKMACSSSSRSSGTLCQSGPATASSSCCSSRGRAIPATSNTRLRTTATGSVTRQVAVRSTAICIDAPDRS